MLRFLGATLVVCVGLGGLVRADEPAAKAVVDKAVKAMGGEEKLKKAEAVSWKTKGRLTIDGNKNDFSLETIAKGVDHTWSAFEGEFNGNVFKVVSVLAGEKGWRKINDDMMDLEGEALDSQKRNTYLQAVAANPILLKSKGFKCESAAEEKVADKPADVLKVTGPDGKDFKLYFDKTSGLLVMMTATVMGFQNDEYSQEVSYSEHKEFDGIKRPTRVITKRDGTTFVESELEEYKVLEKVEPKTFEKPN